MPTLVSPLQVYATPNDATTMSASTLALFPTHLLCCSPPQLCVPCGAASASALLQLAGISPQQQDSATQTSLLQRTQTKAAAQGCHAFPFLLLIKQTYTQDGAAVRVDRTGMSCVRW